MKDPNEFQVSCIEINVKVAFFCSGEFKFNLHIVFCFEERFGTIYTVEKTDGQNICLKNEDGTIINKFFKPYQLLKVNYVEKYEKPTDEEHEKEQKETPTKRKTR